MFPHIYFINRGKLKLLVNVILNLIFVIFRRKIVAHGISNIKKKIRVLGSTSFEGTNITGA